MNRYRRSVQLAGRTLAGLRRQVAGWARSPSAPMCAQYVGDVLGAFDNDLDTPAALKQVADVAAASARHAAEEEEHARQLKQRLESEPIVLHSKAGAQGRLYGSVTTADVAEAIQRQLGASVDRRDLEIGEPIRHLGSHQVSARLHRAVTATLTVEVRAEGAA